ncbi:ATP-binding protein [Chitinimonas sp.]|uniref:ATP-binding protein n=1 Tax=Chitinimonas sp. TaxID=1934313 RepID=UPI002F955449
MSLTLRRALVLAILAGLLVPGLFISYLTLQRQEDSLIKRLAEDHSRITEILVLGMQEPLWNLSPDTGEPLLASVMSDERIVRVIVQDATLGTFLEKNSPERRQGKLKTLSQSVTKQGNVIGKVTVEMDDGTALASIHQYQRYYFVTAAIQLAASLGLILYLLQIRVLNPLQRLMTESIRLARRDLSTPFEWRRHDEIGKLGQSLEITRQSLHSLFAELESKNKELEADIQQRKQIEHALRASEDRYRRLVESTNVVPWEANPAEWRFTYVGPQAETLLGYPLHIWYSEGFLTSYLHQDDRHLAYKLFTETQDKENTIEFECRMLGTNGKTVWVMLVATILPDEAGERHLQGYLIDISARKSTEIELNHYRNHLEELVEQRTKALAAANKELEAFSYSVSHDLRAPLRSVDGFSQVLLEDYADKLDDAGRQYLGRIRRATQNMSNLIDDLLNLSKLTRSEVNTQPVNLSELATEVVQELRQNEPEREVSISIMPNLITDADPKLVRVALQNLLANAWKFTARSPQAEIKFGATHIDGQNAFYVSDNGAGFDMAYADKLFGAFQRLHSPQEFEGNGVGLAIVQRIIHRHNGRVWAKGAPGQGATFYFTLPRQLDRAAA